MDKKFHIQTFGCQMNERDSETLAGMLTDAGYEECESKAQAHVVIINTCSVRDNADKRFFGVLGQLKKRKLESKDVIVCVCGCMMQQQHIIDQVKTKYPWVDIIFGTHNIHAFPKLLDRVLSQQEKLVDVWDQGGEIVEHLPSKRKNKHKGYVNIMYGCNNFCTYCIVPYTRGRERSRDPEEIVREVRELAADGALEITLLGQNVNSYKKDHVDITKLIYMLDQIEGIERIRFMTSHPKDLSDDLINAFGNVKSLCNHIHLPVQSGSNQVLKRMNRKYTREDYLELVRKLREVSPDIAISTDIIVGFPGETEEDFQETVNLCEEIGFDAAFTFLYSIRKGTPAENYTDQIPEEVKHERFNRLMDALNISAGKINQAKIGKIQKILVEGTSKKNQATLTGRTEDFKTVDFPGSHQLIGTIVEVEIVDARPFSLSGKLIV